MLTPFFPKPRGDYELKFYTDNDLPLHEYKVTSKLNDAKNSLDKVSRMAHQLGVFAGDVEKMKEESLIELQKILLSRS